MAHASYAQFVSTEIGINGITRALRAVREAAEDDTLLAQVTPNCPGYLCVCVSVSVCYMKLDVPSRVVYVVINTHTHTNTHTH